MNQRRTCHRIGPARWFRLLPCVLALPWCGAVLADPSADYYRACEHAAFDHALSAPHILTRAEFNERRAEGRRRAEDSCAAFVARLARLPDPTLEERLALFQATRWIGEDGDYCGAAMPFAQALPDNSADALQVRSVCAADREASLALLLRSLEADPRHPRHHSGLKRLRWKVWFGGAEVDAEVDAETLLRHWNTDYEIARSPGEKTSAAALIYATAVEAGDQEVAEEIRVRVRRDLGLDTLEFKRREATLELVCEHAILELDLEELCTGGMERLAAESATLGHPLPPDILRPLERIIRLISGIRLTSGGGGGPEERDALARLQTLLDGYPEHLKSSEHLRVYAEAFREGPERIGALRRAVYLDPGNLAARCGLAKTLERTSPEEAWSIYADLAAEPADLPMLCDPEVSLQRLEERARTGATDDEAPQEQIEEVIVSP